MPEYTVRDKTTGKIVTFRWHAPDPPTAADIEEVFAAAAQAPSRTPTPPAERTWADTATDLLPTAGGMTGGLIGGIGGTVAGLGVGGVPGAVGGATLGGATGEALRQVVNRLRGEPVPETMGAAAGRIGLEGAKQGGSELAGAGLVKGASVVGRTLLENAVRPTQTLLREFPDVMATIAKERLPVGASLLTKTKGSELAARKLGAASKAGRNLLTRATSEGAQYSADEVATPVLQLIDDLAKQPLREAQEQQLAGMISEFLRRHDGPLTPLAVKELKQAAQAIAKPVYRAVEKGFPVQADQALSARFNSAIASG